MQIDLINSQLKNLPYLDKVKLAQILDKEGENLNYWVKKLIKNKVIVPLKKGFYVSSYYLLTLESSPFQKEKYLEYLANMLRYPSYISLEYALSRYDLIPEGVFAITSVSFKSSRVFSTPLGTFIYRKIKSSFFNNFQQVEFRDKKINLAKPAKALFDYLYFKRFVSATNVRWELTEGLRINWDNFEKESKKELEKIITASKSLKMAEILKILKEEKII